MSSGPYVQEAPVIIDKPETVYVMENQSVTISMTLNHVNASVIWKRLVSVNTPHFVVFRKRETQGNEGVLL